MRLPLSQKIAASIEFGSYRLDSLTLNKANRGSPLARTQLHALPGERGEATRWLAEAVEQGLPMALFGNRHAMYKALDGGSKFEELIKRMRI